MQDINQLMQSVEDPHQERERVIPMMILARRRRSMQPKRQYPLTTEVPRHVSNVERLAILPIDAPEIREIKTTTIVEGRITMLIDTPTLVIDLSSSRPRKRRKCSKRVKMVMTQIWMVTILRILFPGIEVMIESLNFF
jgi:hypothetical protein